MTDKPKPPEEKIGNSIVEWVQDGQWQVTINDVPVFKGTLSLCNEAKKHRSALKKLYEENVEAYKG